MVFPLYDENPFKLPKPPYATWALIGINIVIFLMVLGSTGMQRADIFAGYGLVPRYLTNLHLYGLWPAMTLVTGMFLHGGWEHIVGNMIYLWVFGDDIEETLGPLRFLTLYVLAGLAGALTFTLFNPASTMPLIGASGAVSGVLAAYLMLKPCADVSVLVLRVVVRLRAFWVIGGWAVVQVVLLAGKSDDGVAYLAHLGGLAAGALLFLGLRPAGVKLFECVGRDGSSAAPTKAL